MTVDARSEPPPLFGVDPGEVLAPTLDPATLAELGTFGPERTLAAGEVLYRAGEERWDFFVVLDGELEVNQDDASHQRVIAYGPGQFVGELGLLTGQRTYMTARATVASRALVLPHEAFRRMMATRPAISDVVFGALIARRAALRNSAAALTIRIIGSRFSPEALALRTFAERNRLAHTWIDLEEAEDVGELLSSIGARASDTPVVVTPSRVLRRPTPGEFAAELGLTYRPVPGRVFDLVVVGVGPAGLAASVYGASEGLDTVSLDSIAPGGQAGSSSRIENYAGFPNGISGGDLAARTAIQAQRLGAWLASPCPVAGLRPEDGFHVVVLEDRSEIPCRAVMVATGARYRRLDVANLEEFEGCGVYYAATDLEARTCGGAKVIIVGGGNSAGQASVFLSEQRCHVTLVVRRSGLAATMSQYLVERIEADPRITVVTETEVRGLAGSPHLERVCLEHGPTGDRREVQCSALFCFIGAVPETRWLDGAVVLDRQGFVLTDRALAGTELRHSIFAGRDPLPFETSVPGVFAVGDVRSGSMKRVASAVGEGSSAVRSVHDFLARTP